MEKIVLIGASTGGPRAIQHIVSKLPPLKCPILIVQHMPAGFTVSLAQALESVASTEVVHSIDILPLENKIYIVPSPYQLKMISDRENHFLKFQDEDKGQMFNPSIDKSFDKVIDYFGKGVLGVFMSGLPVGRDGVAAAEKIRMNSGITIGQSKETSVCFGLVENIYKEGNIDSIVDLQEIPGRIIDFAKG